MSDSKKILIIVASIIVIILIIALIATRSSDDQSATIEGSLVSGDLETLQSSENASDSFKQVELGMSSKEVQDLMGSEPETVTASSSSYDQLDKYTMDRYRYDFYFQADKLVDASIVNL